MRRQSGRGFGAVDTPRVIVAPVLHRAAPLASGAARTLGAVLVATFSLVTGCGASPDSDAGIGAALEATPVRVVASTAVIADFARIVGGERVTVYTLIRPNVDAHDFDPSPKDIEALKRAAVILKNGAGLEAVAHRRGQSERDRAADLRRELRAGVARPGRQRRSRPSRLARSSQREGYGRQHRCRFDRS